MTSQNVHIISIWFLSLSLDAEAEKVSFRSKYIYKRTLLVMTRHEIHRVRESYLYALFMYTHRFSAVKIHLLASTNFAVITFAKRLLHNL